MFIGVWLGLGTSAGAGGALAASALVWGTSNDVTWGTSNTLKWGA